MPAARTILVVDDEPGVIRFVETALSEAGFSIFTSESTAKALELFQASSASIDLVLTDVVMPGEMDGMTMVRAFRELNPRVKFLFMTGQIRGLPEDLSATCGQVPKPFSPAQIVKAVQQCLDLEQT